MKFLEIVGSRYNFLSRDNNLKELKQTLTTVCNFEDGICGPRRARTVDPRIKSPVEKARFPKG